MIGYKSDRPASRFKQTAKYDVGSDKPYTLCYKFKFQYKKYRYVDFIRRYMWSNAELDKVSLCVKMPW